MQVALYWSQELGTQPNAIARTMSVLQASSSGLLRGLSSCWQSAAGLAAASSSARFASAAAAPALVDVDQSTNIRWQEGAVHTSAKEVG